MMAQLRAQILASEDNTVNLIRFFEACPSRHAMIVAFLAVLEMWKQGEVQAEQSEVFGPIRIARRGRARADSDERAIA